MSLTSISAWIKYKLWAIQQYPDPEWLYRRGGIGDVCRYLRECGSATCTRSILERFGAEIHPEAKPVGPWITIHEAALRGDFANLTIGRSAHVGKEVFLDLSDKIIIEESVTVAMRSMLITHVNLGQDYPRKPMTRIVPAVSGPIVLKRGCSIGAGSIVLHGVTVGEDSIVGAGVVVKRDVPPRTVVYSSPQRPDIQMPESFFRKSACVESRS